jgi:bifunctional non-homologous end joining protein LigD
MPRATLPPSQRQYVKPRMPGLVEFQHPRLVKSPPTGLEWLHEVKFDGYRLQLHVASGRVTIYTRNGHDWTAKFPELAADLAGWPDVILDGELTALDERGQPDFSRLRASISPGKTGGLVVFLFDLLWKDDEDLRPYALMMRKAMLEKLIEDHPSDRIRYVGELPQGGPAMLKAACQLGMEGIVSKKRTAPYRAGRGDDWVKAKCRPGQEFVIGGWRQEPGRAFKALLVGYYDGEALRYAGGVKTGFSSSPDLLGSLREVEATASPFSGEQPSGPRSELHWTRPDLVAAVEFAEWTASGRLRQPSFKGLRPDKLPRDVGRET